MSGTARHAGLLALLVLISSRLVHYISGTDIGIDSGIFVSIARHLQAGKVLYVDAWDLKPPGIFLLNQMALEVGQHGIESVRRLEQIFGICGVMLFYYLGWLITGRYWVSAVMALLFGFLFYHPLTLEGGNFTEEYGGVFALAGVAAVVYLVQEGPVGRLRFWVPTLIAGFFFSAAVCLKEPFVLTVGLWSVYAIVWGQLKRRGLQIASGIAAGVCLLIIPLFGYGYAQGFLLEWLRTFQFSLAYRELERHTTPAGHPLITNWMAAKERVFENSLLVSALAIVGIVRGLLPSSWQKHQGLPTALLLWAVLQFFACMLSQSRFGHYYLMLVPALVLLAASGAAFVLDYGFRSRRSALVATAVIGGLCMYDFQSFRHFAGRLREPWRQPALSQIAEHIRAHTSSDALVLNLHPEHTEINATTGRLSPTQYHFLDDIVFISSPGRTRGEKIAEVRKNLGAHPPEFVVAPRALTMAAMQELNIDAWLLAQYDPMLEEGSAVLWERRK